MFCLAASACGTERVHLAPIPIPQERMDCKAIEASARPSLVPVHKVDWATVGKAASVPEAVRLAKAEVDKLVLSVNQRDGIVVNYILDIEGKLFLCSSDAEWLRDYTSKAAL